MRRFWQAIKGYQLNNLGDNSERSVGAGGFFFRPYLVSYYIKGHFTKG